MSLLDPALLYEVTIHIPLPGRPPRRYTTRFPETLTREERGYIAGHLMGQILDVIRLELQCEPKLEITEPRTQEDVKRILG